MEPVANTAGEPAELKVALWNPNAAASWSLLFSPMFGAYLHARNAEALGRAEEAKANWAWFTASLVYLLFVLVSTFIPAIPEWIFRVASLGLLIGWYFNVAKPQARYVRDALGGHYRRKPWSMPLLVAFGCFLTFMIIVLVLVIVAEGTLGAG